MAISHDFMRSPAVVFQSIPGHTHPDTCAMLVSRSQTTFFLLYCLPQYKRKKVVWLHETSAMHANTSLKVLLEGSDLFSDMSLYGHVVAILANVYYTFMQPTYVKTMKFQNLIFMLYLGILQAS